MLGCLRGAGGRRARQTAAALPRRYPYRIVYPQPG